MVSTATSSSSQYITDFTPTGKSPLAMLAKTCETIGLPDTPCKKTSSTTSPSTSTSSREDKKSPSMEKKKDIRSPLSTPKSVPITTSTSFPLGFPPIPYPFMPFGPFGLSPMGMPFPHFKPPCPNQMMGRPCTTPGCPSCTSPPSDLSSFAPFLSAGYNPFLAAVSSSSSIPCTSGSSLPSFPLLPSSLSSSPSSSKATCSWSDCDKVFDSTEELSTHVKDVHIPSSICTSVSSSSSKSSSKSVSSLPSARFHPYAKHPPSLPLSTMNIPMIPSMIPPFGMPAIFSSPRLMPSLP